MDDIFVRLAALNGGYFLRHQLLDMGFTDDHLRQALKDKVIVRIRHGTYAISAQFSALDHAGKHRILARSVADRLGSAVALSHVSAAIAHGMDSYGIDLNVVHVTRLDGCRGRREAGVVHHSGLIIPNSDLLEIDGRLCTNPTRATLETCTTSSIESGMVTASSALHLGLVAEAELHEQAATMIKWQGVRGARIAITLSDGRFESMGESRSFYMFWRGGLPKPEPQVDISDAHGNFLGRTDFAWLNYRHVGEFDGLVKYGRLNPYSSDPGRTVVDEKRREDNIRGEYLGMSRWTWGGIGPSQWRRTVDLIHRRMEQSRQLYTKNAVRIPLS